MNNRTIVAVVSWVIVLWTCYIFLGSLPYKFTNHPDTQHIFGTIGAWLGGFLGAGVGGLFSSLGAYVVGGFELLTSLILLSPAVIWIIGKLGGGSTAERSRVHAFGGLMAATVMAGAVFFHLFTPLGIEVLHQGKSDGGSLFYAAVSILVLGLVLYFLNSRLHRP
ncbi:MAG: hypothetical protein AAF402_16875 [Pseudomonadota bacterium]